MGCQQVKSGFPDQPNSLLIPPNFECIPTTQGLNYVASIPGYKNIGKGPEPYAFNLER